jgi:hypothetical protein
VDAQVLREVRFDVTFQASPTIRERLKALETEATVLRRKVKALERETAAPIALPPASSGDGAKAGIARPRRVSGRS